MVQKRFLYKYGPETQKNHETRTNTGFYDKYMSGNGIDIGYKGEHGDDTILPAPNCIGVDLDYPGYDGKTLPFSNESLDFVYASHVLEHIENYKEAIQEWYRVIKNNGYIIIAVPHKFLYERKETLPSEWNLEHLRFYTPQTLCREIEESLIPNSYRIVHLRDNDDNYNYSICRPAHPYGGYEIEMVVKKIKKPRWDII